MMKKTNIAEMIDVGTVILEAESKNIVIYISLYIYMYYYKYRVIYASY